MNLTLDDIRDDITRSVKIALEEDIGPGDITAELIPADKTDTATIITREDCTVCGTEWVNETFKQLGGLSNIEWHVKDGDHAKANDTLVTLEGNTRRLLTGERTALNFLQLLSGTATTARQYADALPADSKIKILDTRKTIPGLRTAQKYAVAIGGCHNHRIGLYDAFLIKENHIAACGGIRQAVEKARSLYSDKLVEVEVENIEELKEAIEVGVDVVMLDNFNEDDIYKASKLDKKLTKYELSGNISSSNLHSLKGRSLHYISIGALTKHIHSVDLSLGVTRSKA